MACYIHLRTSDGRVCKGDEPYNDVAAAREDAEAGAKQIVGDALKAGESLSTAIGDSVFDIVDEADALIASLTFADLVVAPRR